MTTWKILSVTALAMMAFAANSLLNREALLNTAIDPASFTFIRLVSGAAILWLIVNARHRKTGFNSSHGTNRHHGKQGGPASLAANWTSALALFVYAAAFSFAYVSLTAATGALLLFAAVQATMLGTGLWRGERLNTAQSAGLLLALAGLVVLLLPGVSAPSFWGAVLMIAAGIAWGVYSLRGKGVTQPIEATAKNFLCAVPFTVLLSVMMWSRQSLDWAGVGYALASGALASGVGYVLWYSVLPFLPATAAASVQLSVPVIAALGGVVLLDETLTVRLALASVAILGGIALVLRRDRKSG